MIAKRIFMVGAVLAIGLASIALLPYTSKSSPVGIAMTLPNVVGMWFGDEAEVTPHEIEVLAKDTQFARKLYTSSRGDQIFVSIVLSGEDMTTSIHRPERCLPAQGWTLSASDTRTIPLPGSEAMQATRLHSTQVLRTRDNQPITVHNLNYYWFVGYNHMTASHLSRTGMDLHDRILHGYNQRWAYVTVAANVTGGIVPGGKSEAETAAMIEDFIRELMPKLRRPDGASLTAKTPISD
jgi:EpsI family protein